MNTSLRICCLLAALTVMFSAGCKKDSPAGPASTEANSSHFNVTWTPGTKTFISDEMAPMSGTDSSNLTFRIKSPNARADSLVAGDIMVVGDYAIRRVRSVASDNGTYVVTTDSIPLTDAMVDADIDWSQEVLFTPEFFASAFGKAADVQRITDDSLKISFKVGDFSYTIGMKLLTDHANCSIIMSKSLKGVKVAEFSCVGVLNKFRSKGAIQIRNHQLTNFESYNNQVNADFTLKAAVLGMGVNLGYTLTIPILKYPVAGLPFFIFSLNTFVVLNASVPADGASNLSVTFNVSADQGFQYTGGTSAQPKGAPTRENVAANGEQKTGAAGPVAVSWGLGFPRMELSVPGLAVAWVHSAYLIGGDYTMLPPCQQAKASFIGAYGYSLGALGVTVAGGGGTLWNHEKVLLKAGQCP